MSKRTQLLRNMKHKNKEGYSYLLEKEECDICIETLEKQIKKKVNTIDEMTFNCPSCNLEYYFSDYEDFNYCPNCGQRIDWSD